MKKNLNILIAGVGLVLLSACSHPLLNAISDEVCGADCVSLAWDANTESDLGGYKVYYGTSADALTQSVDVGNVTSTSIRNLTTGTTYYFAATAYDIDRNESTYSNVVSKAVGSARLRRSSPMELVFPLRQNSCTRLGGLELNLSPVSCSPPVILARP